MTRISGTTPRASDIDRSYKAVADGFRAPTHSSAGFFDKRGALDLGRDRSSHRRFTYLYDDLLQ